MAEPKKASKTFYPKYKSFSKLFKHNFHVNKKTKFLNSQQIKFQFFININNLVSM